MIKTTAEDHKRADMYKVERERSAVRTQTASLSDYINTLALTIDFDELTPANIERLSQLTYRTNQFNINRKELSGPGRHRNRLGGIEWIGIRFSEAEDRRKRYILSPVGIRDYHRLIN